MMMNVFNNGISVDCSIYPICSITSTILSSTKVGSINELIATSNLYLLLYNALFLGIMMGNLLMIITLIILQ